MLAATLIEEEGIVSGESDKLELTEHDRELEQMILRVPVPLCRNVARSAVNYIRRAWRLRKIDPPLAMFCCITGEEEAVRAIFHSLQRHHYRGAERLRYRDHRQKAVVVPFLHVIGEEIAGMQGIELSVAIDRSKSPPQLFTRAFTKLPDGTPVVVRPTPPLNASATVDGRDPDFTAELTKVFGGNDLPRLRAVMRERANERNRWLYASERGLPGVAVPVEQLFAEHRANVFGLLTFFLLIDEHPTVQAFPQEALTAFLRVLDLLRDSKLATAPN